MCRVDVTPAAAPILADLLGQLRDSVARMYGCDPDDIVIGPVDFGVPTIEEEETGR